jgi:hypothetical protein
MNQASNGVESATKIQNLNIEVVNTTTGTPITPINFSSTVAQVLATYIDPTTHNPIPRPVPAYRVHVTGWIYELPADGVIIIGAFPTSTIPASTISPKYVNAALPSVLLPGSTLTSYPNVIFNGSTPEVHFVDGTPVTLLDTTLSFWSVEFDSIYMETTGKFQFDFSFDLFLQ